MAGGKDFFELASTIIYLLPDIYVTYNLTVNQQCHVRLRKSLIHPLFVVESKLREMMHLLELTVYLME